MTVLSLRAMTSGDVDAVRAFFERIPEGDRTFFREDVLAPGVVEGWLQSGGRRVLAHDADALHEGGVIVGYLALLPGIGWSSHVGELRLVVDPARRRSGIGRALARHAVVDAVELGLSKLVVEVVAEQEATVAMFAALGFEAEGLLRDHVRSRTGGHTGDRTGEEHDLLILSHFVDELSTSMSSVGIDDAVTP
jgi:L-amino acid N-acyltransferase YncA